MRRKFGIFSYSVFFLACIMMFSACSSQKTTEESAVVSTGSLDVYVTPGSASVVVTGPGSFSQSFVGNKLINDLTTGQYTVTASATGYGDSIGKIGVIAGETSKIVIVLMSSGPPDETKGNLNFSVNPPSSVVKVTGPAGFEDNFIGNKLFTNLTPGIYTAEASAPGFADGKASINVVEGLTSSILLILQPLQIIIEAPRAVYRDADGNLIPITSEDVQAGKLFFYAWVQDKPDEGINSSILDPEYDGELIDPGQPTNRERTEYAPSLTQNLLAAWIGFKDNSGDVVVVRPVIGADVRWEIDQFWSGRFNSMQFGTSDDNRVALGYGVMDDQADTRTNNARLENEHFPLVVTEYPLYNQTGIGSPFVDGFTWATLFSPDRRASGRVVAVATINGEEIGKQILYKNFKPKPKLEITKTVDQSVVNMVNGSATVTWTVTVRNVGDGDATNVNLNDILSSGDGESYEPGSLPPGSTPYDDGFNLSFPLCGQYHDDVFQVSEASGSCDTMTVTFTGTVTEPGTYCNMAQILSYNDEVEWWDPIGLNAQACFTALEADVSIVKDFVAEDETTSLGQYLTVTKNTPAKLRVRVVNNGTGTATDVLVNDVLSSGEFDDYELLSISWGTPNGSDGFDTNVGDLAAGSTATMIFSVKASVDGEYCDTASVTDTSGVISKDHDTACLNVATPNLTIRKCNRDRNVMPGESYTSKIIVGNNGNATAENVVISDLLGLNSGAGAWVIYVSSNFNGDSGTLYEHTATAPYSVSIPVGGSIYFYVVSRIPLGGAPGRYCDTATATSTNADTVQSSACVCVPAFAATQTQLVDLGDPVSAGDTVTYSTVLYNEQLSNEGVDENKMKYSFGLTNPIFIGTSGGQFSVEATSVYRDPLPIVDPITGLVLSGASNPTAMLMTEGVDYTISYTLSGVQKIDFAPSWALLPGTAVYITHISRVQSYVSFPSVYTTGFLWSSSGVYPPDHTYTVMDFEPTTVIPGGGNVD